MTNVSIIIPFNNVEKYIEECLNSVINQTMGDIEIILINDGSTDNSYGIAAEYAKNDSRIKLLSYEEKKGQGYARNEGLKIATGKYIGFVDSDDKIYPTMFEKLYTKAEETSSDITMCAAELFDDLSKEVSHNDYYLVKPAQKFAGSVFSPYDVKEDILNINVVIWNKIYNREFLLNTGVEFTSGYIYEDLPYFFETFLKANRISFVDEILYSYRQNRVFSTMQNSDKKVYDRIPMVEKTYNILINTPYLSDKKVETVAWVIDDIFHRFTLLEEKYYTDYYKLMQEFFLKINLNDDEMAKLASCSYCYDEFCTILNTTYLGFWKFLIEKYKTSNRRIRLAEYKCNLEIKAVKDYWENYQKTVEEEKININTEWGKKLALQQETSVNEINKLNKDWENKLALQQETSVNEINKLNRDWENKLALQQETSVNEINKLNKDWENKLLEQQHRKHNQIKKMGSAFRAKLACEQQYFRDENKRLKQDFGCGIRKILYHMNVKHLAEIKSVKDNEEYRYNKLKEIELKNQKDKLTAEFAAKTEQRQYYFNIALQKQKDYYENRYLVVKVVMKLCRQFEQIKNKIKRISKKN